MNATFVRRSILVAVLALAWPVASFAGYWSVSVGFAPPALPYYVQPPCPAPGYIWTPGYWAWSDDDGDYYWVPGAWEIAPAIGLLWTPGYWSFADAGYVWHAGYWGPRVGYYGGINYGYGYFGRGYDGGYWREGEFFYNRTVNNISTTRITNVYNRTVVVNNRPSGPSFSATHAIGPQRPGAAPLHYAATPRVGPPQSWHAMPHANAAPRAQFAQHFNAAPRTQVMPQFNAAPHAQAMPHFNAAPHAGVAPRFSATRHDGPPVHDAVAQHYAAPRPQAVSHPGRRGP